MALKIITGYFKKTQEVGAFSILTEERNLDKLLVAIQQLAQKRLS